MMEELKTTVKKISSGVWAFDQEMVRCFLVVGNERALLFDTGAAPCDLPGMIREITSLPLTVIHSHGDGDHTANDNAFPVIYAHPAEHDIIRASRPDYKGTLKPVTGISSFDLGGRILQVVETPGHTPGSISLLDRTNRILFSGDTVSYGPVFMFGKNRDIHAYRQTLEVLQSLGGFDTIYPCHNTCPVSRSVISGLIDAVDGTLDGSIEGSSEGAMPMPDGAAPLVYASGKCGILYIKDEK